MSMPDSPSLMLDRRLLPIAWEVPDDDRLLADVLHLMDQGLLARDAEHLTGSAGDLDRLLGTLGQRGCYEAHVRSTGALYACPPWCISTEHARVGIAEPGAAAPIHLAHEGVVRFADGAIVSLFVEALGSAGRPAIHLEDPTGTSLTPGDARALAAALLAAADVLDEVGGRA